MQNKTQDNRVEFDDPRHALLMAEIPEVSLTRPSFWTRVKAAWRRFLVLHSDTRRLEKELAKAYARIDSLEKQNRRAREEDLEDS
jgi:hypothetical protein